MAREAPITRADEWFIGEDWPFGVEVDDEAATPAPVNMNGWTLEWVLRDRPNGPAALITKTVGAGIAISNGAGTNSLATITIARADTLNLAPGTYFHTLRRTNAGASKVLAYGPAVLRQPATR